MKAALLAGGIALALQACANNGGTDPSTPAPTASCNAAAAQFAIGQLPDDALVARARQASGADMARVLRHDQMTTKEFRQGRLNLRLDAQGRIAQVDCG